MQTFRIALAANLRGKFLCLRHQARTMPTADGGFHLTL